MCQLLPGNCLKHAAQQGGCLQTRDWIVSPLTCPYLDDVPTYRAQSKIRNIIREVQWANLLGMRGEACFVSKLMSPGG